MNEKILQSLGWRKTFSGNSSCVVCHTTVYSFGWASPGYKFYHDECLEKSARYKKIERAAQPTNQGDGVQTAAKPQAHEAPRLMQVVGPLSSAAEEIMSECLRCQRPAKPSVSECETARPFKKALSGFCANCVVTQFLKEFPPFKIGVEKHGLDAVLGFKPMLDQFAIVLRAGNSELHASEIDWAIVKKNWDLPFPPAPPNQSVKRTAARAAKNPPVRKRPPLTRIVRLLSSAAEETYMTPYQISILLALKKGIICEADICKYLESVGWKNVDLTRVQSELETMKKEGLIEEAAA